VGGVAWLEGGSVGSFGGVFFVALVVFAFLTALPPVQALRAWVIVSGARAPPEAALRVAGIFNQGRQVRECLSVDNPRKNRARYLINKYLRCDFKRPHQTVRGVTRLKTGAKCVYRVQVIQQPDFWHRPTE
jgi:hypothetical protein